MITADILQANDVVGMATNQRSPTRSSCAEPFADDGRFAGLTLERFEIFEGEDRIWEDYERTGDAKAFGAQWAHFTRASVFPSLATALDPAGGAECEEEFGARLEAGMAKGLAASPARMAMPLAKMELVKADAPPRR